jgi:hypothetical protein
VGEGRALWSEGSRSDPRLPRPSMAASTRVLPRCSVSRRLALGCVELLLVDLGTPVIFLCLHRPQMLAYLLLQWVILFDRHFGVVIICYTRRFSCFIFFFTVGCSIAPPGPQIFYSITDLPLVLFCSSSGRPITSRTGCGRKIHDLHSREHTCCVSRGICTQFFDFCLSK